MLGASVDKVGESCAAVELGKEDGGVGLRFGALDPLQAGADGAPIAAAFPQDSTSIAAHPHLALTTHMLQQSPLNRQRELDYSRLAETPEEVEQKTEHKKAPNEME